TYRLALRARAAAARQPRQPPQEIPMSVNEDSDALTLQELRTALDEELNRLPERYRAPVVLCYLEDRTQDEAARRLGWSKGTVRRRLDRGRALLRARLTRRGIALATGLAAATLIGGTARAVSPLLAARAVRAALHAAAV